MTAVQSLTIGTRGSRMALRQTDLVANALTAQNPALTIKTKIIITKGDRNMAPIPLDTVGKAWFTAEIEDALQKGEIDLAVHSHKDLPPEMPEGFAVAAVLKRSDPRDALVARAAKRLTDLPEGAIVGTDSLRRKALLLQHRPDLVVRSIRGNVDTRLRKLYDEQYDALVLAAAGLERLERLDAVSEFLDPTSFVPAIGQGVLAVEARSDNTVLWGMLRAIQHQPTLAVVAAEQAFSRIIGGGCKLPVSCYVYFERSTAHIIGMVGSKNARECVVKSITGSKAEAVSLAEGLARKLLVEPFMTKL